MCARKPGWDPLAGSGMTDFVMTGSQFGPSRAELGKIGRDLVAPRKPHATLPVERGLRGHRIGIENEQYAARCASILMLVAT
jgi:hypothetical protein